MYSSILDPNNNNVIDLKSKKGINLIKNYLKTLIGGSNPQKKRCWTENGEKIKIRCPNKHYCDSKTKFCEAKKSVDMDRTVTELPVNSVVIKKKSQKTIDMDRTVTELPVNSVIVKKKPLKTPKKVITIKRKKKKPPMEEADKSLFDFKQDFCIMLRDVFKTLRENEKSKISESDYKNYFPDNTQIWKEFAILQLPYYIPDINGVNKRTNREITNITINSFNNKDNELTILGDKIDIQLPHLGEGSFGTIYSAKYGISDCAVKVPKKEIINKNDIVEVFSENVIQSELFCRLRTVGLLKGSARIPKPYFIANLSKNIPLFGMEPLHKDFYELIQFEFEKYLKISDRNTPLGRRSRGEDVVLQFMHNIFNDKQVKLGSFFHKGENKGKYFIPELNMYVLSKNIVKLNLAVFRRLFTKMFLDMFESICLLLLKLQNNFDFIHRDMHAKNIMCSILPNNDPHTPCKINKWFLIDFGLSTMILKTEKGKDVRINGNEIGPYSEYDDNKSEGKKCHDLRLLIYMICIHKFDELEDMLEEPVFSELSDIYQQLKTKLDKKIDNTDHWWCCYDKALNIDSKITHPDIFLRKFVNKPEFRKYRYFHSRYLWRN